MESVNHLAGTRRRLHRSARWASVWIGIDSRRRAPDNILVERLWRSVKRENTYVLDYDAAPGLEERLHEYFHFYSQERMHQSLPYHTPAEVHLA